MSETTALTALLSAEHAAIYAYGVLGAHLDDATRKTALSAFDAHRFRRDDLVAQLRSRRLPAPSPAPSYDVVVVARPAALALAVRIENDLAVLWRDLVGSTDDPALRRFAVAALQDSAVRATVWRRTAGVTPLTESLPGQA